MMEKDVRSTIRSDQRVVLVTLRANPVEYIGITDMPYKAVDLPLGPCLAMYHPTQLFKRVEVASGNVATLCAYYHTHVDYIPLTEILKVGELASGEFLYEQWAAAADGRKFEPPAQERATVGSGGNGGQQSGPRLAS